MEFQVRAACEVCAKVIVVTGERTAFSERMKAGRVICDECEKARREPILDEMIGESQGTFGRY